MKNEKPKTLKNGISSRFWHLGVGSLDSKFNFSPKKVQGSPLGVPDPGQDSLLFYQTIDKGWKTIYYNYWMIHHIYYDYWMIHQKFGHDPSPSFSIEEQCDFTHGGQVLPKTPSPIRKWNLNALFSIKEIFQKCKSNLKYFLTPWSDPSL